MDGMTDLNLLSTGLRTAAMLFLVLGLLVLVLYLMKRMPFLKRGTQGDALIKVLSSLHLSPKERLELIEISGEKIVLGITPGNITLLTKIGNLSGENPVINGSGKTHETQG